MALNIIIKNTFLDVEEVDGSGSPCGSARRSSSVPCTWRPWHSFDNGNCEVPASTRSLASTAASEEDLGDGQVGLLNDVDARDSLPSKKASFLNPQAAEFQMPAPYEPQVPTTTPVTPLSTRLNPEARVFEPTPVQQQQQIGGGLPAEIWAVINSAKLALTASPHVASVKVTEGALGQTTTIVTEVHSNMGQYGARETLNVVKAALLGAAARSQMTYILGWGAVPFQDMPGDAGFKGMIGSVPMTMQDSICWDTYQKGYCPRRALCRWCHPLETDLAPLRVILERSNTGNDRFEVPPTNM